MDVDPAFESAPTEAATTRRSVETPAGRKTRSIDADRGEVRDEEAAPAPSGGREDEVAAERPKLRRPSQLRARWRGDAPLYEKMGGAVALRRLVRRFHELMETAPEAEAARAVLHVAPADLGPKLYEFLSGWLGGPDLYAKRHGAPKLKRRHFLVPIGPAQRDGWLLCFRRAAEETIADRAVVAEILPQIESLAHYLADRD